MSKITGQQSLGKIFIIGGLVYLVGVYFFMFRGDSEEEAQPTLPTH
ncbi:hypothetical protein QW180_00065 [Vibrio sinaloensis]|nr:hypothetical protein [Vibrio sinaloensis]